MINVMLDDGLPYHILIEELGEAGQGLNLQNLTDWLQGRYQDYLKNRQDIEYTRSQIELAADLLRELGEADPCLICRACALVAGLQMFHAICEYGDETRRGMLQANPASYLRMLNSLCNLTNTLLQRDEQRQKPGSQEANGTV